MGHGLPSLSSNVSIAGGKTQVSLGCKRFGQVGSLRADQDRRDIRVLGVRLRIGGKKSPRSTSRHIQDVLEAREKPVR